MRKPSVISSAKAGDARVRVAVSSKTIGSSIFTDGRMWLSQSYFLFFVSHYFELIFRE
jgi:hypothetical protein